VGRTTATGIAQRVRELSQDVFRVGESSLYPALQRLTLDGYIKPEWGVSENNRRARYYTLTAAGRKQPAAERQEFDRIVAAIRMVLDFRISPDPCGSSDEPTLASPSAATLRGFPRALAERGGPPLCQRAGSRDGRAPRARRTGRWT
jgi:hypothetical protein